MGWTLDNQLSWTAIDFSKIQNKLPSQSRGNRTSSGRFWREPTLKRAEGRECICIFLLCLYLTEASTEAEGTKPTVSSTEGNQGENPRAAWRERGRKDSRGKGTGKGHIWFWAYMSPRPQLWLLFEPHMHRSNWKWPEMTAERAKIKSEPSRLMLA